ncbi:HD-GYP domain-containing protein [Oleiphilus messinensis]|uniref:HD-GYP domain-containing protein n=1 Tax=Oleiphilus messinensis TaxID=141451 RepID=A0A1Y0IIH2_9GAMM|nr:HD-GYP domain-containing protein [Oleiphilus messinensis]ARU59194.1 HD-GYP domain-containing protein [Oleiphilus messinensis]
MAKVLVEIPVTNLEIGMYVAKLDCPWEESPFVYQGFFLYDQSDIQELQSLCKTVFVQAEKEIIETEKTITLPKGRVRKQIVKTEKLRYISKIPAHRELEKATMAYQEAKQLVGNILLSVRLGKSFNMNEVKEAVSDIVSSILRNPEALRWLTLIKNKDDYTAEHCLRVCVLAVSLGREMGLTEQELIDLGICGFVHDIGKAKIPDEVLNKPGRFTREEFEIMKSHAIHGKNILVSQKGVPAKAIDVAHSHHERLDGTGYPRKLASHQITEFSKIVSIVDAFDAITSVRVYKEARSSLEALRIIYDEKGSHFDDELAERFIKLVGIYPTGHIAELTDGQVGIIVRSNNENRLKPKVLIVRDAKGQKCKETVIDLAAAPQDERGTPLRIKDLHPNGAFNIQLDGYIKRGLRLSEETPELIS